MGPEWMKFVRRMTEWLKFEYENVDALAFLWYRDTILEYTYMYVYFLV